MQMCLELALFYLRITIIEDGGGIWTPYQLEISPIKSFFAASFSFFSFVGRSVVSAEKTLVGAELNESKGSRGPSVRQSQSVERRDPVHKSRRGTALLMPRLRISVFKVVNLSLHIFPFFFSSHGLIEVIEEAIS